MKKKNLIILLLFPFLLSVFCIITVNTTYNMIDVDISSIEWKYSDMEGFSINEESYLLEASGVNQRYYAVSDGDALVWTVQNKSADQEGPCAEIIVGEDGKFYLKPLRAGEIIITCSNKKGNVQRRLDAVIYKDAAIMLYPKISASQSNIDKTIYYGEYDSRIGTSAKIEMTLVTLPASMKNSLKIETSPNITYDIESGTISINRVDESEEAYVTVSDTQGRATPMTYSFTVVDEGVNVYNYEDLLYCTNGSEGGHIAVLRKHFESLENVYQMSGSAPLVSSGELVKKQNLANNIECFGIYDPQTKSFSFEGDVYRFTTTYNKEFIDQWNAFVAVNNQYSPISDTIAVGLHVQKDFYGNGYTINLHNLTYPYAYSLQQNQSTGAEVRIPQLTSKNIFRGPLKLYSLGDPSNTPLVSLYGQDNIGMYVDGNGITVNDVAIKNCDFGDRMANLDTVGTVVEIHGNGVTVKNSKLSNGKNVLRSFSSMDFSLENSILQNARNFLFVTGSNEYAPVDRNRVVTFPNLNGGEVTMSVGEYLAAGAEGDVIVNSFLRNYLTTPESRAAMKKALLAIQDSLNDTAFVATQIKGSSTVTDTYFYRSGISAICMECLFSSPFLENGASPSLITDIFASIQPEGKSLVPYTATGVSGLSYPVTVRVKGNTRFYDYKEVGKIDLSGLIEENISAIANSLNLYEGTITIDDIFPLQSILTTRAQAYNAIHSADGSRYCNIPVAYYGGGVNLSSIVFETDHITGEVKVDLLENYLYLVGNSSGGIMSSMRGLIYKTVISVAGFEPFAFHFVRDGYLYGEYPNISDLVSNS